MAFAPSSLILANNYLPLIEALVCELYMAHNQKLVLGAVDLVGSRVQNSIAAMSEARDSLESVLISSSCFERAPFESVGLIIRYGKKSDDLPTFRQINKNHGDLPISIEVDVNEIYDIHNSKKLLVLYFKKLTLLCLLAVAEKYALPKEELEKAVWW